MADRSEGRLVITMRGCTSRVGRVCCWALSRRAAATTPIFRNNTTTSSLVDWSRAAPSLARDAVRLLPQVITAAEEERLVAELESPLRRRRLMANHWDSVIEHYREVERRGWEDPENAVVVSRVRALVLRLQGLAPDLPFLPVHVIDLAAEGFIKPHVDSVKFSGCFVAGLSLLSPAIMRLRGEDGKAPPSSMVRMLLEPRSLYVLSGDARYHYAHEILPPGQEEEEGWAGGRAVKRGRRISLIFRDELLLDEGRGGGSTKVKI
jgi:alkylated DNA repair protein alkB homolog 7